jgi:hypothetical protein
MSKTASERANPPPRRKSCAACTRAKRRCDLAHPACVRCAGRGLACVYPHRSRAAPATPGPAAVVCRGVAPSPMLGAGLPVLAIPVDISFDALMDEFCSDSPCAVDPLPPFLSVLVPECPGSALPAYGSVYGTSRPAEQGDSSFDINSLLSCDMEKQLMSLNAGTEQNCLDDMLALAPQVLFERITYVFDYLRKTPRVLAETLGTPWCHPMVFRETTPQSFQGTPPRGLTHRPKTYTVTNTRQTSSAPPPSTQQSTQRTSASP